MGEQVMKWTLHVKEFGKIKEAAIKMDDIVIFNGENNTGKSYLMSLLYYLCTHSFYLQSTPLPENDIVNYWLNWFKNNMSNTSVQGVLSVEEQKSLNELLNIVLDSQKEYLVQQALNYPIPISKMWIDLSLGDLMEYSFVCNNASALEGGVTEWKFSCTLPKDTRTPLVYNMKNTTESVLGAICYILDMFMDKCLLLQNLGVSFLPASRTGFMLAYPELSAAAVNIAYATGTGVVQPKLQLTKPCIDFLSFVAGLRDRKECAASELAGMVESTILKGKLNVQTEPFVRVTYLPENSGEELSLHVSSGVVTEVAPLVLALRYSGCKTLFIEEPEMCLHPELQWEVAKILADIAAQGINLVFTTHSDLIFAYFTQIAKHRNLKNKKLCLYEFKDYNGNTVISEMPVQEEGATLSLFNKALENIMTELNEVIDDEGEN